MIKPFHYYIRNNLVRKSIPNPDMARSLLKKAEIRLKRIKGKEIDEENSSIVFEDIYEALREASQSLMEIKGFKPYSHEAAVSFLKEYDILKEAKTSAIDNYRVLRNNSVYKAEKVSPLKCKEALDFSKKVIPEIETKFNKIIHELKGSRC
jgi:hypothetical protein